MNLKAELEIAELHRKVDHLNAEVQAALTTQHADLCARLDLLRPVPAIAVTEAPEGQG